MLRIAVLHCSGNDVVWVVRGTYPIGSLELSSNRFTRGACYVRDDRCCRGSTPTQEPALLRVSFSLFTRSPVCKLCGNFVIEPRRTAPVLEGNRLGKGALSQLFTVLYLWLRQLVSCQSS